MIVAYELAVFDDIFFACIRFQKRQDIDIYLAFSKTGKRTLLYFDIPLNCEKMWDTERYFSNL